MKRLAESSTAWVFGLAVTVLLISIWGRAVVVDEAGLAESLTPLSESALVVDQVAGWLGGALEKSGADPALVDRAIGTALNDSHLDDVFDNLVAAVVRAAAKPGDKGAAVDVAEILKPAVPEIVFSLSAAGVPVDPSQVSSAVSALEPLVIVEPGASPRVGASSPLAFRLATSTVLAFVALIGSGYLIVRTSPDRSQAVRELLMKIALSSLSFGILLKIGSWILDPRGGRAPVSEVLSGLANGKWLVPFTLGVLAAAASGTLWLFRGEIKPGEEIQMPSEEPTPRVGQLR